jgi:hypothetical protein
VTVLAPPPPLEKSAILALTPLTLFSSWRIRGLDSLEPILRISFGRNLRTGTFVSLQTLFFYVGLLMKQHRIQELNTYLLRSIFVYILWLYNARAKAQLFHLFSKAWGLSST